MAENNEGCPWTKSGAVDPGNGDSSSRSTLRDFSQLPSSERPKVSIRDPAAPHSVADSLLTWRAVAAAVVIILYAAYVYDEKAFHDVAQRYHGLRQVDTAFRLIEQFSPFHEVLLEDELDAAAAATAATRAADSAAASRAAAPAEDAGAAGAPDVVAEEEVAGAERLFTTEELKRYDGREGSPGLYLSFMGRVFDVAKGRQFYGPDEGGYGFFAARDGSRAFVSGKFDEEGLIDDVEGLSHQDYLGLEEWMSFYYKDYTYVGKLVGRYFDATGAATAYSTKADGWLATAKEDKRAKEAERELFPPCNSEWSEDKGQRVWCTAKTTGTDRGWVGVPRRFASRQRGERCACVKDFGPPSAAAATGPEAECLKPGPRKTAQCNVGDLRHPGLAEYAGCSAAARSCQ